MQDLDREAVDQRIETIWWALGLRGTDIMVAREFVHVGRESDVRADPHGASHDRVRTARIAGDLQDGAEIGGLSFGDALVPLGQHRSAVDRPETAHTVEIRRQEVDDPLPPDGQVGVGDLKGQDRDPGGGPCGDRVLRIDPGRVAGRDGDHPRQDEEAHDDRSELDPPPPQFGDPAPALGRGRPAGQALDRMQPPLARNTLERMNPPVLEAKLRAGHQIPHRSRDQDLTRAGLRGHTRPGVHDDSRQVLSLPLDLAGVDSAPNLQPQLPHRLADRPRAADRARRTLEGGEETIAGGVHLAAAEALDLPPHAGVMPLEQSMPAAIA